MPPIWNDIKSLLPASHPPVAPPLAVGSLAPLPAEFNLPSYSQDTLIAFVRHCGCPFAKNEVKQLAGILKEHDDGEINVIIVCMAQEEVAKEWFSEVGTDFGDDSRVRLVADPTRHLYALFGLSTLPFTGLFSRAMLSELQSLARQGIVNTATRDGSNRWQNSGGFAIKKGGEVRFVKVAEYAGDMVDYRKALESLKERAKL